VAVARATVALAGQQMECFVLDDGRRVVGVLSAALLLGGGVVRQKAIPDGAAAPGIVTFQLPGQWQLLRGLTVEDVVAGCLAPGARRADRRPELLVECAVEGLHQRIEQASEPLAEAPGEA
jgi:hypothetical protein